MPAQRFFVLGAIVRRDSGERFIFTDRENRAYRWQAYEHGIEWSKQ
jgi:hypothetical protein